MATFSAFSSASSGNATATELWISNRNSTRARTGAGSLSVHGCGISPIRSGNPNSLRTRLSSRRISSIGFQSFSSIRHLAWSSSRTFGSERVTGTGSGSRATSKNFSGTCAFPPESDPGSNCRSRLPQPGKFQRSQVHPSHLSVASLSVLPFSVSR